MYPTMAKDARDEGFEAIARTLEGIGKIEKEHQERYKALLKNVEGGAVFKKDQKVKWRCRNCGFIHHGVAAPDVCVACAHPRAHFELLGENW